LIDEKSSKWGAKKSENMQGGDISQMEFVEIAPKVAARPKETGEGTIRAISI